MRRAAREHLGRLDRADVAVAVHLAGGEAEGADRDQREADRAEGAGFGRPASVAEAGVAGEEQVAAGQLDDEARPQGAVAVGEPAAATSDGCG